MNSERTQRILTSPEHGPQVTPENMLLYGLLGVSAPVITFGTVQVTIILFALAGTTSMLWFTVPLAAVVWFWYTKLRWRSVQMIQMAGKSDEERVNFMFGPGHEAHQL